MEIILDVQGFRGPDNRFIVKELASITIQHEIDNIEELSYTLFQPPYHWKVLPLKEVLNYLTNNKKIIYVKGIEKKLWIQNLIDCNNKIVIDLENFNCPSLKSMKICNNHFCNYHYCLSDLCALENVKNLKDWFVSTQ
ncbi:GSCOCG00012691001-RA-CDS [Cotesia congregata]|nr:GSCOCG00012691001-RA-CDS [Cotesia congregata]